MSPFLALTKSTFPFFERYFLFHDIKPEVENDIKPGERELLLSFTFPVTIFVNLKKCIPPGRKKVQKRLNFFMPGAV